MANVSDKSILTAAGKALLAQLNAEEKALVIDKMIFANVPNRPEYPQPDDVVPTDNVVHQAAVEQRGRLSEDSVIYSTTLASNEGPFEFNWTGAYCSEYGVLVTIDHHSMTPKTVDEPGVSGNTLVRSVVLEYKDIAEITNITVDASTWQYNATPRMKKMDNDVAQANIDQNGKDWFIEEGFLVTPQASAFSIKAGAGYVSGNRVALEFDRSIQVPNKPSFIYIDAHREGTPTGEQVTLFNFVVSAEEKDDYIDSSTGKDVPHFVCKIAQVLGDGSVSDLRLKSINNRWEKGKIVTSSRDKYHYSGSNKLADGRKWFAPTASKENPVVMGDSPDDNWQTNKIIGVTSTDSLRLIAANVGDVIKTSEFYRGTGYGGWDYYVVAPNTYDDSMPVLKEGVHFHVLANGNQAVLHWKFPIPIEAMGMKNDGSDNLIGGEERLPHCIAVGLVSSGHGKFFHKGNLPTPTKSDLADFMLRMFLAPIQEYSFTWLGAQSGEILLDLSSVDNGGKKIGFYLSHTDIDSTDYFTQGGPWDSSNKTGFQRNITINDVLFKNKAWVYGGDNQAGVPAPLDYDNLKHEWWSTSDESSIGICINYASNVDLKGTIAYGFTANMWLYTWNSSWCAGRARNGRYGYVFPAGTTSSIITPWASGIDIGYHWGVPDFIGPSESAVGIKPIGYTLISPACDGVSDCAYNILNASSVDLKQPNNEGTANTMIRIGRTVNGNIAIDGINYFGTESNQERFPIKSLIEYRSEANFCSLTVRNFKGYLGSLFPASGVMFNVVDAAKSNFLSTTKLVNVRRDVGVAVSNISDQEMAKIYTENNIDYLRVPQSDNTASFTIKQSDLLDIISRYGTFADSSNFFTLAYEYAESSFQRYAVVTHFVLQRTGASYENITVLEDTLTAKFIKGTGGSGENKQISIDVLYSDGLFTFTMTGAPTPRRHSAVISYMQSA